MMPTLHDTGTEQVCFWCPGCDEAHCVSRDTWTVDTASVTISPSVLVTGAQWETDAGFYKPTHASVPARGRTICHSFVTDGSIQFLTDSTHTLAGQTVGVPDWPI